MHGGSGAVIISVSEVIHAQTRIETGRMWVHDIVRVANTPDLTAEG
jgi:hypothetical protein